MLEYILAGRAGHGDTFGGRSYRFQWHVAEECYQIEVSHGTQEFGFTYVLRDKLFAQSAALHVFNESIRFGNNFVQAVPHRSYLSNAWRRAEADKQVLVAGIALCPRMSAYGDKYFLHVLAIYVAGCKVRVATAQGQIGILWVREYDLVVLAVQRIFIQTRRQAEGCCHRQNQVFISFEFHNGFQY